MWGIAIGTGSLVIQLLVAVFFYGRLTQRTDEHGNKLEKLEAKTDKHDGEIGVVYGTLGLKR